MKKYIQAINKVDTSKIRVERDDRGDEIIIVPSYTMPDDIVMNGILYPAAEIERSYRTLEGTPAPIGHPHDADGNFVSASSEIGINRFHAGVFNGRVVRVDNRIYVEKRVNVRIAESINEGKRLIRKLRDLMEGLDDEPVHTSTGVFLESQELEYPRTNEKGKEYHAIARNMHFDHDAILLDEEGAATPLEGVGMLVNKDKSELAIMRVNLQCDAPESAKLEQAAVAVYTDLETNSDEAREMALKDKLIGFFKANQVDVAEDASDDILLEHLQAMKVNGEVKTDEESVDVDQLIANSVKEAFAPVLEKVEALEARFNKMDDDEKEALMKKLKDNGYDDEKLKGMSVAEMKEAVSSLKGNSEQSADFSAPEEYQVNAKESGFTTDLDKWGE